MRQSRQSLHAVPENADRVTIDDIFVLFSSSVRIRSISNPSGIL